MSQGILFSSPSSHGRCNATFVISLGSVAITLSYADLQPFFQDFAIPSLSPTAVSVTSETPLVMLCLQPDTLQLVAGTYEGKPHRFQLVTKLWLSPFVVSGFPSFSVLCCPSSLPLPCLQHPLLPLLSGKYLKNQSQCHLLPEALLGHLSLEAPSPLFVPSFPWLLLERLTIYLCF